MPALRVVRIRVLVAVAAALSMMFTLVVSWAEPSSAAPVGGLSKFTPLQPERILDTRNALTRMREANANQDMDAIWESHGSGRRSKPRPPCSQPECARAKAQQAAS
jgi:hypothetical protein